MLQVVKQRRVIQFFSDRIWRLIVEADHPDDTLTAFSDEVGVLVMKAIDKLITVWIRMPVDFVNECLAVENMDLAKLFFLIRHFEEITPEAQWLEVIIVRDHFVVGIKCRALWMLE